MMWDTEHCSTNITISSDKLLATNGNRQNTWCNVRGFPAFVEGISYREFKLKFTNYLMIGVETKECKAYSMNQYPGQTSYGWCLYSTGQTYHASNCVQQQSPFSSGDTVGILVDTLEGRVAYYRNGKVVKATFTGLPKNTPLFPVVSFYSVNDTATIVPGKNVPNKYPKGWGLNKDEGSKDKNEKRRKAKK